MIKEIQIPSPVTKMFPGDLTTQSQWLSITTSTVVISIPRHSLAADPRSVRSGRWRQKMIGDIQTPPPITGALSSDLTI